MSPAQRRRRKDLRTNPTRIRENMARRDAWLQENADRIRRESLTAVCLQLKRLGIYGEKTNIHDMKPAVEKACIRLGVLRPSWRLE